MRRQESGYDTFDRTGQCGIDIKDGAVLTAMERRTVPAADLARLKVFAKANGATINDAFMALFARSFCKNTGTAKIKFPSTMDLRRFIPQGAKYGISNYSSMGMCAVVVQPGDTPADTVLQVSRQMRAHKSGNNILRASIKWNLAVQLPWFILKRHSAKHAIHPVITYSNIGIIDAQQLTFGGLNIRDAYLTASIKPRPYLQMTVCTYDGHCVLGCNIYGTQADQQFVSILLDDTCAEIQLV
jgi:NRPS condensation-like uncharacterized protein